MAAATKELNVSAKVVLMVGGVLGYLVALYLRGQSGVCGPLPGVMCGVVGVVGGMLVASPVSLWIERHRWLQRRH